MCISTTSTTCFLVKVCLYWFPTNYTRRLFSTGYTIASDTTVNTLPISLNLERPFVDGFRTNNTVNIGISYISLIHPSSIPQTSIFYCIINITYKMVDPSSFREVGPRKCFFLQNNLEEEHLNDTIFLY
jgi:hypothetical protein